MKTSELSGPALDWAVAKAAEYLSHQGDHWMVTLPGVSARMNFVPGPRCVFTPSTRWAQGGPIIEREGISAMQTDADSGDWEASIWLNPDKHMPLIQEGPTPLIAAMRCFVASRLGDEVDIPEAFA